MNSHRTSREDTRGFRWRFEALQRKLEHDLTRARGDLQRIRAVQDQLDGRAKEIQAQRSAQECAAAAAMRGHLDAGLHAYSVRHLAQLHRFARDVAQESAAHRVRVSVASRDCEVVERKLASLLELRQEALDKHAQEQSRRRYREADLDWLARRSSSPAQVPLQELSP